MSLTFRDALVQVTGEQKLAAKISAEQATAVDKFFAFVDAHPIGGRFALGMVRRQVQRKLNPPVSLTAYYEECAVIGVGANVAVFDWTALLAWLSANLAKIIEIIMSLLALFGV